MLFSKGFKHVVHNLFILTLVWLENSHVENWWNTISQYSIYVSSHYFQVHQSLEQLTKIVEAGCHDLVLQGLHVLIELGLELVIGSVGNHIICEFRALESTLFENLHIVDNLGLHACYHPKLIAIWVLLSQILVAAWNCTWLLHQLFVLLALMLILFGDKSLELVLVLHGIVLLPDQFFSTSLPIRLIGLVMLSQYFIVC